MPSPTIPLVAIQPPSCRSRLGGTNSGSENVAMEMNLSETAFLVANANGF
jgi:hypothetical protein